LVEPEKGPLTVERLNALWPRVVDDARAKTPMLGALLQVTEVVGVEAGTVTIRLLDTNPVHAEGLERQREVLAQLVARYVTEPVRIKLRWAGPDPRHQDRSPGDRPGGRGNAGGPRARRGVAGAAARRRTVPGGGKEARLGPAVPVSAATLIGRVGYRRSRDGAGEAPRDRTEDGAAAHVLPVEAAGGDRHAPGGGDPHRPRAGDVLRRVRHAHG